MDDAVDIEGPCQVCRPAQRKGILSWDRDREGRDSHGASGTSFCAEVGRGWGV